MSIFPITVVEPLVTITPFSRESIASYKNTGQTTSMNDSASGTWPTANKALFFPFAVSKPITILNLFWVNGAAVSGNVDVGIYDAAGTKLISTGSTAQAGTNALQSVSVTATQIGAGQYYLAMAVDNTTATIMRVTSNGTVQLKLLGAAEQSTAFALPSSATMVTNATNYVPFVGLSTRSVV